MKASTGGRRLSVLLAFVVGLLVSAGPADARAGGDWRYFNDCPADQPSMLASPAGAYTACVVLDANGGQYAGAMKFGNATLIPQISDQFGVVGPNQSNVTVVPTSAAQSWPTREVTVNNIATDGSLLASACSQIPSGPTPQPSPISLLPLEVVKDDCYALANELALGTVFTANIEPAGTPSDVNLAAPTAAGQLLTLPVKIGLQAAQLGSSCFIGSDRRPITLHLFASGMGITQQSTDPNGYPVTFGFYGGGSLTDTTFTVPAASGCGPDGALDGWSMISLPCPLLPATTPLTLALASVSPRRAPAAHPCLRRTTPRSDRSAEHTLLGADRAYARCRSICSS
jgi:hypothetical protein